MSELVNISPDVKDQFYRYKCEKSIVLHKNKNSIIPNLYTIASQLSGNIKENNKYEVYCALIKKIKHGLSVSLNRSNNDEYEIVIKGIVKSEDIERIINKFVKKYILCPNCQIPEWNGNECSACGYVKMSRV